MKKVTVISTSLRHGSNSEMLADQFTAGAMAAGNQVEKISPAGNNNSEKQNQVNCMKFFIVFFKRSAAKRTK